MDPETMYYTCLHEYIEKLGNFEFFYSLWSSAYKKDSREAAIEAFKEFETASAQMRYYLLNAYKKFQKKFKEAVEKEADDRLTKNS